MKPLAIDLYCGLGGWTEGLLAEGYRVVGYDIEAHDYGDGKRYPAQLVLQDVLTLHGRQFKDAALIVASPPCQEFSSQLTAHTQALKVAKELLRYVAFFRLPLGDMVFDHLDFERQATINNLLK